MPKELIVSVNGREKKIAIVENGRTTEFYIERGEASQGIVGNIYKGRVMRVLPGMQSAFVDIGLERDAFLYVSDFFDEEEEFERIVVDKTKGEPGVAPEAAVAAAAERLERARLERERQMESAQERAEPAFAGGDDDDEADTDDTDVTGGASVSVAAQTGVQEQGEAEGQTDEGSAPGFASGMVSVTDEDAASATETEAGGKRRRRKRRGDKGGAQMGAEEGGAAGAAGVASEPARRDSFGAQQERADEFPVESVATPFTVGADSFERVVDDEAAAEEGSMFKDARVQERLLDQIRGVEFDLEDDVASAEVGSLLPAGGAQAGSSAFQRIDDSDLASDESTREPQQVQETVAASIAHLAEEFTEDASSSVLASTQSFERVSDDDASGGAQASGAGDAGETQTRGGGRGRGTRGGATGGAASKGRRGSASSANVSAVEAAAEAAAEAGAQEEEQQQAGAGDAEEGATKRKRTTTRSRAAETSEGASKRASATKGASKSSSKKGGTRSATKSARKGKAETSNGPITDEATDMGDNAGGDNATLADAEASITPSRSRSEFARRGGRRRRRPGGKPGEGGTDEPRSNGDGEAAEVSDEEEFVAAPAEPVQAVEVPAPVAAATAPAPASAPPAPRGRGSRGGEGGRSEGGRSEGGRGEGGRSEGGRGAGSRGGRGGGESRDSRDSRGGDGGGGRGVDNRGGDGSRGGETRGGDGRGAEARGGRPDNRPEGRGEGQGRSDNRGGGRRDRLQPTITDLLREGQEIIVQIAKEPIAQKGARITSHIALPGRFLVYMPTIEHLGVSRKIESDTERARLRKLINAIVREEDVPSGGFIVRTAGIGMSEQDLRDDARYLVRTWKDIRRNAEKQKAPALAHKDLDLVQRILRDQLSEEFTAIRVDSEEEYQEVVEFVNRIQPRLVNRVKLYTRDEPILEAYGVQAEIEKAIKPRVWLRSGGYLVINQTEALVAIDVNTGKFVGRGGSRLEDTITRTNMEAAEEIARQIRLRDLGGIIVLDLIDMEDRRNRNRVMAALQDALRNDKSPTKVLSFNDFGLVIMTRKRVKQSLERTLCSPCPYCQGGGLVKSPQTVCYEILEEARSLARGMDGDGVKQTTLRLHPEVERALRTTERDVLGELEAYLGPIDITSDDHVHQEQFDFAFI